MKKSFFKKIMLALTALSGVVLMASCQTTEKTATVPTEHCQVAIYTDSAGKKVATVTLAVSNPTIYNTTEITFHYEALDEENKVLGGEEVKVPVGIRHGVAGAFTYVYEAKNPDEAAGVKSVRITEAHISGYQSAWETYMPAFIVVIILAAMSVLFYSIELFARGLSREDLKAMFLEHIASELMVFGLILIICLIPLIFSSWVTTVILLGGFAAALLVNGLLTLIRMRHAS